VHADQTVYEMVEEVLARQAKAQADRTGQPFEDALAAVLKTEAGRQPRELENEPHVHQKARDWQEALLLERAKERLIHLMASDAPSHQEEERHYSWVEGYIEWLEGKEAREQYYVFLEEELQHSKDKPPGRAPRVHGSGPRC
jgi:hypothetical protein